MSFVFKVFSFSNSSSKEALISSFQKLLVSKYLGSFPTTSGETTTTMTTLTPSSRSSLPSSKSSVHDSASRTQQFGTLGIKIGPENCIPIQLTIFFNFCYQAATEKKAEALKETNRRKKKKYLSGVLEENYETGPPDFADYCEFR